MDIVEAEEWRAIPGLRGYEASSLGSIRSIDRVIFPAGVQIKRVMKGRLLKQRITKQGYCTVNIFGKSYGVHRLIAATFLGQIPAGHEVNHKFGVKTDNRLSQIEIVTPLENNHHATKFGLNDTRGEGNAIAKLSNDKARQIRKMSGKTLLEIANEFGISKSIASLVRRGKRWKHIAV